MVMWNSFTDKIIVTSQNKNNSEKKTTFNLVICHNFERRRAYFSQDYPNVIRVNLVHLCPFILLFPFAVFLLRCSTVLSGYCNVSFYVLGILGKKKKAKQLIKCLVVLALEH